MNFANPASFFWMVLAVPVVVFYILKVRLRRIPVSTIMFWRQIYEEKPPRSIWQHLRHLISLLVQLCMLSLLAIALTEPYFSWQTRQARKIVLVIDNSASMNATDIKPSRLAQAKSLSHELVTGLRFQDEMAIVSAGTQPQVICGLTGHPRTLRTAIDAILAADGPTQLNEGITLARRLVASSSNGQVIVVTDGCFAGAEKFLDHETSANNVAALSGSESSKTAHKLVPETEINNTSKRMQSTSELSLNTESSNPALRHNVLLALVGQKSGNVGITRFQARRSLLDPVGYEILCEVVNASDETVECRLELELNDQVLDVIPLKLKPQGTWTQTFEKTAAEGGHLLAKLNYQDVFMVDNQAWAILPKREPQIVTLVTEGNLFLEKVLEASPLVKLTVQKPDAPLKSTSNSIIIFHRFVPTKRPAGNLFFIDPRSSNDLWKLGEKLENPIVTKQERDSPLMSHVRLDNILMPEAFQLTFTNQEQTRILVSALSGAPLFASCTVAGEKIAILTVNLDEGDLPLRTAFPILTTNVLTWFAGAKSDLRESLSTGAIADVKLSDLGLPQNAIDRSYLLRRPKQQLEIYPSKIDRFTIGPLDQVGIWRLENVVADKSNQPDVSKNLSPPSSASEFPETGNVSKSSEAVWEIACNLANRSESQITPGKEILARGNENPSLKGSGIRPIWYYLLVSAWALAGLEWLLYQRRWIS